MGIFGRIDTFITWFDGVVWGLPLIILILVTGIFLTVRLGLLQVRYLGKALKFMVKNEEDGHGEVTSFGALCTALSATIGTGNIVGVATAISAGGPGALFWMILTAFLGMATKYSEGLLAVKYRTIDEEWNGRKVQMACKDICILWSRSWLVRNRYIYTGEWYLICSP